MAYTGIDKEIYDSGVHFRPLQEYTQQQWTPPAIMGQNTNAGITAAGEGRGQSPTGGNVAGTPFAQGGRIGYATRGFVDPEEPAENIFEFMQDQGVPYGQMASAEGIPFMWEEFLAAKELDPDLTYENFLDAIDKSPSDFYAQGGIVGLL